MNISNFSTENRPSRDQMEEIGRFLLYKLSMHMEMELHTFKEHYVEEGSIVLTFYASTSLHRALEIQMEGSLMFDVRSKGAPPVIDAELLLFGSGTRIGMRSHQGISYLRLTYDVTTCSWGSPIWLPDAPEEWENVSNPRETQYSGVVRTYDFTE